MAVTALRPESLKQDKWSCWSFGGWKITMKGRGLIDIGWVNRESSPYDNLGPTRIDSIVLKMLQISLKAKYTSQGLMSQVTWI